MQYKSLLLCTFFLIINTCFAQKKEVPVEVVIEKLQHLDLREKNTDAVYKFFYDTVLSQNNITEQCLTVHSLSGAKRVDTSDVELKGKAKLKAFVLNSLADSIVIKMETYENDRGELCDYDKGDDYHSIATFTLKVKDLNPGIFSDTFTVYSEKQEFAALMRIRYGIPEAEDIVKLNEDSIIEVTRPVSLKSSLALKNKQGLTYHWEYKTERAQEWTSFNSATNSESIEFNALKDIFKTPITKNETLQVRMKAVSVEIKSNYTAPLMLHFTPAAPEIPTDIALAPTCPNNDCGSISMAAIKTIGDSVSYYLIKGKSLKPESYPDRVGDTAKIDAGTIAKVDSLSIESLAEGDYNLVIYNNVGAVGKAFAVHPFTIIKYKELKTLSVLPENAGCDSTASGQISLAMEGGNPDSLTYYISPIAGKPVIDFAGRKAIFTKLPAGSYSVIVRDKCNQEIILDQVEVKTKTEASGLEAQVHIEAQPNNSLAEGIVKIQLGGGTGNYAYNVSSGSLQTKGEIIGNSGIIPHLPIGSLELRVVDNAAKCLTWDTILVLGSETEGEKIDKTQNSYTAKTSTKDSLTTSTNKANTVETPAKPGASSTGLNTITASEIEVKNAVIKDTVSVVKTVTQILASKPEASDLKVETTSALTNSSPTATTTNNLESPGFAPAVMKSGPSGESTHADISTPVKVVSADATASPAIVSTIVLVKETPAKESVLESKVSSGVELKPVSKITIDSSQEEESNDFTGKNPLLDFYNTSPRRALSVKGFKDEEEKSSYTIIVEKSQYRMIVLDEENDTVRIYPVVFGNKDQGNKTVLGDRKTPEGTYRIESKRDHNEWDKIMFINYPNAKDRLQFEQRKHRGELPQDAKLGEGIAFHGTPADKGPFIDKKKDWTLGCVATKNDYIEEIFSHVGVGAKVIIRK